MVKEQITNTGVIPAMTSADDGYSSQEGLEEVLGLGVKVVSISGAKGKRLLTPSPAFLPPLVCRRRDHYLRAVVFAL